MMPFMVDDSVADFADVVAGSVNHDGRGRRGSHRRLCLFHSGRVRQVADRVRLLPRRCDVCLSLALKDDAAQVDELMLDTVIWRGEEGTLS
jgi:hypothetical protein